VQGLRTQCHPGMVGTSFLNREKTTTCRSFLERMGTLRLLCSTFWGDQGGLIPSELSLGFGVEVKKKEKRGWGVVWCDWGRSVGGEKLGGNMWGGEHALGWAFGRRGQGFLRFVGGGVCRFCSGLRKG